MEAVVTVGFGESDVVLETVGHGHAEAMEKPQNAVTLLFRLHQDPQPEEIGEAIHLRHGFEPHFVEDAVGLLLAGRHFRRYSLPRQSGT